MNVRPFEASDEPILREIYERSGYSFAFPEDLSSYCVVTDDAGCPIMAAGYRLVPEITLISAPKGSTHPLVKLRALGMLHEKLGDILRSKGFRQAFGFLDPLPERAFGRNLRRHFQWAKAWTAYAIEIGGDECRKA